jgi:outer membrane protein OmpA-like peptidoglycan-associated protein
MKYIKSFGQYSVNENQQTQDNADYTKFRAIAQKVGNDKVRLKFQYNGKTMKFSSGKEETVTLFNTQKNEVIFKSVMFTDEVKLETGQLVIKLGKIGKETVEIPYGINIPGMQSVGLNLVPTIVTKPVEKIFDFAGGFEVNKWDILPELQQRLETQLKELEVTTKLHVDGYASADGISEEHDMQLSVNRAKAVQEFLINKGFKDVSFKGHGRTTNFGKAEANRRIVIKTIK